MVTAPPLGMLGGEAEAGTWRAKLPTVTGWKPGGASSHRLTPVGLQEAQIQPPSLALRHTPHPDGLQMSALWIIKRCQVLTPKPLSP